MIKTYLKNTRLWILISYSNFYQKIRNPEGYAKTKREIIFYTNLLESIEFRNNLIFDVGANIGNKSVIFAKIAKNVIAFEPTERLFLLLKKRLKHTNVKMLNYALGSSVSSLEFFVIEGNDAYNSLSKKHIETTATQRDIAKVENVSTRTVHVDTLENAIQQFGIPKYIKIDVEGYEYEVIKGLKNSITLISFEVNLPDFLNESIKIIEYLAALSDDKYLFNFTADGPFLNETFINKVHAIRFLTTSPLKYMEVYAKLY